MSETLASAVAEVYRQVSAPEWAAPNLDGLADVLRDLSWLPPGEVPIMVPALTDPSDARRLGAVVAAAVADTARGARPVVATGP